MPRIYIQKLCNNAVAPCDIQGVSHTMKLPPIPLAVNTWHDLLAWIYRDPAIHDELRRAVRSFTAAARRPRNGP